MEESVKKRKPYASIATVNFDFIRQRAGPNACLMMGDMLTVAAPYWEESQ